MFKNCLIVVFLLCILGLNAQKGSIRGNVYDKETGEPLAYASVFLKGTQLGDVSDIDGFFNISGLPVGEYTLVVSYLGFDTVSLDIAIRNNQIINKQINMVESSTLLGEVSVSGKKQQARTEVKISSLTVTPKEIKALPSTGGEADIAQYLQIIPGVVSTGDQGGQIYIRGGSPVQNRILLDGVTIFNPFHSIGLFSVFETEAIRTVDVLTGVFRPNTVAVYLLLLILRPGKEIKPDHLESSQPVPLLPKHCLKVLFQSLQKKSRVVSLIFSLEKPHLLTKHLKVYTNMHLILLQKACRLSLQMFMES